MWPAGESRQPLSDVTTILPRAPTRLLLLPQHLMPIPFGHLTAEGQLGMIGIPWEGILATSWRISRCPAMFVFVDV